MPAKKKAKKKTAKKKTARRKLLRRKQPRKKRPRRNVNAEDFWRFSIDIVSPPAGGLFICYLF